MRITFFTALIASFLLLVSATIWEGFTSAAAPGDLQGDYSIATNSFPNDSVVDITNLGNGKMVRAIVVSGLTQKGFLASISRNAADAIDLGEGSACSIRMAMPADTAFSGLSLGPVEPAPAEEISAVADTGAAGIAAESAAQVAQEMKEIIASKTSSVNDLVAELNDVIADKIVDAVTVADNEPAVSTASEENTVPEAEVTVYSKLSMIPVEERPPQAPVRVVIAANNIPAIVPAQTETIAAPYSPAPEYAPPPDFSPFQAPLISGLEKGKWYVQVAAYALPDHVEDEISRIGMGYPVAIQNVGTETKPLFRVLLGPLNNKSESTALLQNFKNKGYTDAFLRNN